MTQIKFFSSSGRRTRRWRRISLASFSFGTDFDHSYDKGAYTVRALAERLAVSESTIWRLRDEGKIPSPLHIRGNVRWDKETIERWVLGGCRGNFKVKKKNNRGWSQK